MVLNTLIRPELSAVTLCVFLTAGPLLIVDRPVRILGLQMLLCLEYALLARQMKHSYLAFADSVNMVCCVFLGFGIYIRLNHVSLRQALLVAFSIGAELYNESYSGTVMVWQ